MKKLHPFLSFCSFLVLFIAFVLPALLNNVYAEKLEVKPTIRIRPAALSFDCTIQLKAQKIVVTNISKSKLDIEARAEQPWILVKPQRHDEVPPMGTGAFTVSINCGELKGVDPYVGNIWITGGDFGQKVPVRVKPQIEFVPR